MMKYSYINNKEMIELKYLSKVLLLMFIITTISREIKVRISNDIKYCYYDRISDYLKPGI